MTAVIYVYKKKHVLELYLEEKLKASFVIALGTDPIGQKEREGDGKTPEGIYYICTRNEKSKYYLFLGLNYPNVSDARRGRAQKLVSEAQYQTILDAAEHKERPCWDTPLGGAIGIHGGGTASDWTAGCIALDNVDMAFLWAYASLGTAVHILP